MGRKLFFLTIFSLAFGLTEAMAAYYFKTIIGLSSFNFLPAHDIIFNLGFVHFANPSTILQTSHQEILALENWREGATMVMLFGLANLAGNKFRQKLGAFLVSFALWDLSYYIFLRIFTGQPQSVWDTDLIALGPVATIGPVISALVVSSLLLLLGLKLFLVNSATK